MTIFFFFFFIFFFFFKQKTAYEIGTGDWSSDVCSSDLESVEYANIEERFPPFAIAALTLLVLEVLLSTFVYRSVA